MQNLVIQGWTITVCPTAQMHLNIKELELHIHSINVVIVWIFICCNGLVGMYS